MKTNWHNLQDILAKKVLAEFKNLNKNSKNKERARVAEKLIKICKWDRTKALSACCIPLSTFYVNIKK